MSTDLTGTEDVENEATEWFQRHWDPSMPLGDWWRRLADSGFAFPPWPEDFGGRGLSGREAKAVLRARRAVGAYGPPNGVATFLVAPTLLVMGSPEQQRRHLPGIVERDIAVVVDGRARAVESVDGPNVELTADVTTFILLAAGRLDPQACLDDGRIAWAGDAEWGDHMARNLAYTM